jgi:hypothetical protein
LARRGSLGWVTRYQRQTVVVDAICGLLTGTAALVLRFPGHTRLLYVAVTAGLPLLWITWVAMFGGYDPRFIGLGSEEFRRIINSGISRDRDRVLRLETGLRLRPRSHRPSGFGRRQYGCPGRDAQATAPAAPAWTLHAPGDGRRPRQCGLQILWKTCAAPAKGRGAC